MAEFLNQDEYDISKILHSNTNLQKINDSKLSQIYVYIYNKNPLTAWLCTCCVKFCMLSVRSTLRFSVLSNSRPMNHIEQSGELVIDGVCPSSCDLEFCELLTKSKHFGLTWANAMCWFLSRWPISIRTFASTNPHHSKWSSAVCELTKSTIKCLYLKRQRKGWMKTASFNQNLPVKETRCFE